MKKLLVLALVLGLASVASAALTWSVDSVNVAIDGTVTVGIISDSTEAYPGGVAWIGSYDNSGYGEITGIVATAAAGGDYQIQDPVAAEYEGWWTVLAKDTNPPFTVATGKQFDVTIKGLAEGQYNLVLDDLQSAGPSDSMLVIVPEPMTIGLLGLGGLFLRRRK